MKRLKLLLTSVLILAFSLSSLIACAPKEPPAPAPVDPVETTFTPSYGLSEGGFWSGVTARDHVILPDYLNITIPASVHQIPESAIQAELEAMLSAYASDKLVTDRVVRDGDTVNIDFVGSVDGVEFAGGSTGGMGTDVTIGVTNYIDGFLEQLVGRNPGESFDIEVRFPDDYGNDELDGKDAVFAITVNYILESELPELTDAFVAEFLVDQYGYNTVSGLTDYVRDGMSRTAVALYVQQRLVDDTEVKSLPPLLVEYQEKSLIDYYQSYADQYGMGFADFLNLYLGVSSSDALLELYSEDNESTARMYLVLQAVAEDAGLTVEEEDIIDYFQRYVGTSDYGQYTAYYGLPYIKLIVLQQKVLDYVVDRATLE
jgi:trigger factor